MVSRFATLLMLCLLISCGGEGPTDRRSLLPGYIGQAGEVLVIMETQYWNSSAGELIREVLSRQAGVLPQYEPMFTITQYPPEAFDRLLRPHRNILFVEIKKNIHYKEPKVQVIHEKYAKGQVLVNCFAYSENDFVNKFEKVSNTVLDKINQAEVRRNRNYNDAFGRSELNVELKDRYELDFDLFPKAEMRTSKNHFFWLHRVTARPKEGRMHDVQQGILVYDYPYVNDSTFTRKFLLAKRDSVLKKYMPGPAKGSYMTTEYYFEPEYKEINLNGEYAVEVQGLFKMENAFMGGPFISVTRYDEARGRIVTAEGFVFAPKFDKREYLREVEAVVKSLSFAEADSSAKTP